MGQTKFGKASGFPSIKDGDGPAKKLTGGNIGFGGLPAGAVTRKQDDSKEFAGEEQKQVQGRGVGRIGKGPMRMAGLFGGLFGRRKGRKRFGLF